MATESWPASLPQWVTVEQFQRKFKPRFIRTTMDRGPAKVRRRSTFEPIYYKASIIVTEAQLATFDSWFHTNLLDGVNRFDKIDPIDTATTYEFRFLDTPSVSAYGPVLFKVDMELERLT